MGANPARSCLRHLPPCARRRARIAAGALVRDAVIGMPDGLAALFALACIVGGIVPLSACSVHDAAVALRGSIGVTLVAPALLGAMRARFTGAPVARGAFETTLIGSFVAGAALPIARARLAATGARAPVRVGHRPQRFSVMPMPKRVIERL